jgi:hypothetical protein
LSGCVSSSVQRGTVIGAVSGAALGAGTGLLISDDKLLGSSPESRLALDRGGSVGAGALIGVVFGAIVGAMIGHGNDHSDREAAATPASAQAHKPAAF